jgi:hypothetical protein
MHTTIQQGKFDDTKCVIRIYKKKKAKTAMAKRKRTKRQT